MGTRGNQDILPMGREEHGVEAHFKGPRMQVENPAAGVMAIHGEPPSVEGIAGGRKDEEVQTSSGAISVAIQARVSTVVERVVQGVEIGTLRNGCPGRVEITVVVDHILLQACDGLNGRTMTNCSMRAQVGSHHFFALDLHHAFWQGFGAFREIEARLNKGEEIELYKRKKMIGRLVPARPKAEGYPDFAALSKRIFGRKKMRKTGTEYVSEARGEY